MKIKSFFQGKNASLDQLTEVEISGPKRALERLEEQGSTEILSRREQILNNATTSIIPMNEANHDLPLTIENGPSLNTPVIKGPLILEEHENYTKERLNLSTEGEGFPSPSVEEVTQITHMKYGNDEHNYNPAFPVQSVSTINELNHYEIEEDLDKEADDVIEQDYDPFDESLSETGFTEVEVTFIDGKKMSYLFNIGKSKFEQQWLDEIYSVGVFTAKDIYGNLVTLSPKGKDNNGVAFNIKEGTLPK